MLKKTALWTVLFCLILTASAFAKPVITADKTYFDITTGLYHLEGNVYIEAGSRIITAGQAKVSLATLEVWGSGKITLKQDDLRFAGDTVYVSGAKKEAAIEGVHLERTGLLIKSDKALFNWETKIATFTGHVEVTQNDETRSYDSIRYNVITNEILP